MFGARGAQCLSAIAPTPHALSRFQSTVHSHPQPAAPDPALSLAVGWPSRFHQSRPPISSFTRKPSRAMLRAPLVDALHPMPSQYVTTRAARSRLLVVASLMVRWGILIAPGMCSLRYASGERASMIMTFSPDSIATFRSQESVSKASFFHNALIARPWVVSLVSWKEGMRKELWLWHSKFNWGNTRPNVASIPRAGSLGILSPELIVHLMFRTCPEPGTCLYFLIGR